MKIFRTGGSALSAVMVIFFTIFFALPASAGIKTVQKRAQRGKSRSLLSVTHNAPNAASIGQAVPVSITVKASADLTDVTMELDTDPGLDMTTPAPARLRGNLAKNASFIETITVIPRSNGILYVNVVVTGLRAGKKTFTTVSIPVNVGPDNTRALKSPGPVKTDSQNRRIIIVPAQEK